MSLSEATGRPRDRDTRRGSPCHLSRVSASFNKYAAITRTQIINSAAYPLDLAMRSLMIVMFMFIFMQLWKATYRAVGQTIIARLSLNETMWYLMIAETIVLSKPRLSNTIAEQVKDGSVAYLLNKPYCCTCRGCFAHPKAEQDSEPSDD